MSTLRSFHGFFYVKFISHLISVWSRYMMDKLIICCKRERWEVDPNKLTVLLKMFPEINLVIG